MGAKTDTNKAKEEIVAFCPREGGAGRFRTESGQEESTAVTAANFTSAWRMGGENGAENWRLLSFTEKALEGSWWLV